MNRMSGSDRHHCRGAWVWEHHHGSNRSQMTSSIRQTSSTTPSAATSAADPALLALHFVKAAGGTNTRIPSIEALTFDPGPVTDGLKVPRPARRSRQGWRRSVDRTESDRTPPAGDFLIAGLVRHTVPAQLGQKMTPATAPWMRPSKPPASHATRPNRNPILCSARCGGEPRWSPRCLDRRRFY
jgi:hypothetical protein